MGKQVAREIRILQLECGTSNVYITACSDQLWKKISVCMDIEATCSILKRDLVETRSNLVINQQEQLLLRIATGESSTTLKSVHMKLKLPKFVIEGKFIVADVYDECVFELDLMQKYGLMVAKEWTLKSPAWWSTTTDNGYSPSPTSLRWGGSNIKS